MEVYVYSKVITYEEAKGASLFLTDTIKSTNTILEFVDMIENTLCLELEPDKINAIYMGSDCVLTVSLIGDCATKFHDIMSDTNNWNKFKAVVFHSVADVIKCKFPQLSEHLTRTALNVASLV